MSIEGNFNNPKTPDRRNLTLSKIIKEVKEIAEKGFHMERKALQGMFKELIDKLFEKNIIDANLQAELSDELDKISGQDNAGALQLYSRLMEIIEKRQKES